MPTIGQGFQNDLLRLMTYCRKNSAYNDIENNSLCRDKEVGSVFLVGTKLSLTEVQSEKIASFESLL